jgi:hypothetical protein
MGLLCGACELLVLLAGCSRINNIAYNESSDTGWSATESSTTE